MLSLTVAENGGAVPLSDLLMELESTEEYYSQEFRRLHELEYLYSDESGFSLDGHARELWNLYDAIQEEIVEAEEDPEEAEAIFESLID